MGTNDFTQETKMLWEDNYKCWECNNNKVCDHHHTVKRGHKSDDAEKSPLNHSHMCRFCHELADIHSKEKRCKYLNRTANYLYQIGYELEDRDFRFLEKYKLEYI